MSGQAGPEFHRASVAVTGHQNRARVASRSSGSILLRPPVIALANRQVRERAPGSNAPLPRPPRFSIGGKDLESRLWKNIFQRLLKIPRLKNEAIGMQ